MLFHDDVDETMYLMERGSDSHLLFIKKRSILTGLLKDFGKSQQSKRNWVRNKWKMLRSIKKYANSFASKKFHRQLGRFLATRNFIPKTGMLAARESYSDLINLKREVIHELNYYHSAIEQAFLESILDELIAVI